jgi:hypothetical protein
MHTNLSIKVGTAGGTVLSIVPNIHSADVLKTVVLAAVGAVVSFSISWLLKWILKKRKK